MDLISNGITRPEKLLHYIKSCHQLVEVPMEDQTKALQKVQEALEVAGLDHLYQLVPVDDIKENKYGFSLIENHKGDWTVGFKGVPDMGVVLAVLTFFETEQVWDNLRELIFNHETREAVRFESVGGSIGSNKKIAEVINFIASQKLSLL